MKKYLLLIVLFIATVNINAQDKKADYSKGKSVERVNIALETLTSNYSLDTKQIIKAKSIFEEYEVKLSAVKDKMVILRETKMTLDTKDQEAVDNFNSTYHSLQDDRKVILAERETSINSILTEDQKKEKSSTK